MMSKVAIALVSATTLVAFSSPSLAEDLTTEKILQTLAPKKVLTRSLGAPPPSGLSAEDKQFVNELKTRAIIVTDRERLSKVVAHSDLPSLDIEIYFATNSAAIAPEAVGDLVTLGKAISDPQLAHADLLLSGHTDARGSNDYNQELSEKRAQSVKRFLSDNFGVSPGRLIAVGYGEEQLKNAAVPDADENRRVTIVNLSP